MKKNSEQVVAKQKAREEKLTVIAAANGWRMIKHHYFYEDDECQTKYKALGGSPPGEALSYCEPLPNYLTNLNAIRSSVLKLPPEKQKEWAHELQTVLIAKGVSPLLLADMILSDSESWCDAYIKTVK